MLQESVKKAEKKRQCSPSDAKGPNILGIVAEYNPFHNGHLYHLRESIKRSEAEFSIAVMSGNFLQRGEPAMFDKWVRAETAVRNGVDLVLELPFVFACNSAEYFGCGAVTIFEKLGCVTHLAFGSECADLNRLQSAARLLAFESEHFKVNIKNHLSQGVSYPKAREAALREGGHYAKTESGSMESLAEVIREPNNILAVEYLKQLIRKQSDITPIPIERHKAGYKDLQFRENVASAAAIRVAIAGMQKQGGEWLETVSEVIPQNTYETLAGINSRKGIQVFHGEQMFQFIRYKIASTSTDALSKVFSVGEGLENRIAKSIIKAESYDELIKSIVSKRYTQTRIQRALVHILTNMTKKEVDWMIKNIDKCIYARVLSASAKGCKLLSKIKQEELSSIPVYTNINRQVNWNGSAGKLLRYDIQASDIYNIMRGSNFYNESDYVRKPYVQK